MSAKHFDSMAKEIRKQVDMAKSMKIYQNGENLLSSARFAAFAFANVAEQFNPKFDRHRFRVACGLEE